MRWKIGQLVKYHDSNSNKRKLGIVVKSNKVPNSLGGHTYEVLWNSGLLSIQAGWELFNVDGKQ